MVRLGVGVGLIAQKFVNVNTFVVTVNIKKSHPNIYLKVAKLLPNV